MSDWRSVLLLCRRSRAEAENVAQHIAGLTRLSRHDVVTFDPFDRPDAARLLDLDEFDVVVVHYTLAVVNERYLPTVLANKIAAFNGLKVQFIQDEYRWIDAVTARMRDLGIRLLFTCVPAHEVPKVYGSVSGLDVVQTLPAYVPDEFVRLRSGPPAGRPVDVGYRGRSVPYWLGRLGQGKAEIGRGFLARAADYGLRCDIAVDEESRIYGHEWQRFLASCRGTLGTESGASIADYDGSVEAAVREYLARRPRASFEEVEDRLLAPYEGNVVINTVSSRIFEAAALRTALVLFPGEYSSAVAPWEHYIPLEKDFSNMAEVAERLRDDAFLAELTGRAQADLVASGRYALRRFVAEFDDAIAARSKRRRRGDRRAYRRARMRRRLPPSRPYVLMLHVRNTVKPVVMTALVLRDPAVRRLALELARERETWTPEGIRSLAGDLWRLAALRRGVRLRLFHVVPSVEEAGRRLVLSSRPGAGRSAAPSELADQVVWYHGVVSKSVPLVGRAGLAKDVGWRGSDGAHVFTAIVSSWRRHRDAALAAFSLDDDSTA